MGRADVVGPETIPSDEIKEAVKKYQAKRDADVKDEVKDDTFTKTEIEKADLTPSERRVAVEIAEALGGAYDADVEDPAYRKRFRHFCPE